MKVLELSIGKLTVIERVNWSWFVFYLLFATYCVFRQLDEAYVSYPYFKLFLINKLFSLKSGCTKKLYWDGKRITNVKVEDIIIFFGTAAILWIAMCSCQISNAVGLQELCREILDLSTHVLEIHLFVAMVATLVIGLLKRVKRRILYSHHLPGSGPPLGSKETAQEPSCKKRMLSMWSAFALGSAQFMRQFQLV